MKKLFLLLFLIVPLTAIVGCDPVPAAQAQHQFGTMYHDSINDISGTDTTVYVVVRYNWDWTVNINATGTITGTGGKITVMESIDGTYYTKLCTDSTTAWCDTIKTGTNYRFSGTSFPARYLAVKITKGTCKGKLKVQYSMKRPND